MNRFFASCIMVASAAFAANAEINFPVPDLPKVKYVEITAEGINLREKPSTSSNKLVWDCEPGTDACQYNFKAQGYGTHPSVGDAFPYITENGDWVNFSFFGNYDIPIPVWTMKKFVKELDVPSPLTSKEKENLGICDISYMPGYALWVYEGEFEENYLYIGRKVGEEYVFVYCVPMPSYSQDQSEPLDSYTDYRGEKFVTYNKSLMRLRGSEEWGYQELNLSALNKKQIEWLFEDALTRKPDQVFLVNKYGKYPFSIH